MISFLEADISQTSADNIDFMGNPTLKEAFSNYLPNAIYQAKSQTFTKPLLFQILLVIDMSKSLVRTLEALESLPPNITSLSEYTQNENSANQPRRIIRVQDISTEETGDEMTSPEDNVTANDLFKAGKNSIHKLILQDSQGRKFYGIEQQPINGIGIQTPLGGKVLLSNIEFKYGVAILSSNNTQFLGGCVSVINRNSRERLKDYIQKQQGQQS